MKSIEEQPRYVIDQDMPKGSDIKILPEEQEKAIGKLLKSSGHILSEEERDLVGKLLEKLHQEADRVRTLRKLTVGDKPLDSYLNTVNKKRSLNHHGINNKPVGMNDSTADSGEDETEPQEQIRRTPVYRTVVGFKPEEVVRRYIECWNQQKFGAEYDCFSRDFLRTERDAYVTARHNYYQQQLGLGGMKIQMGEVLSCDEVGGMAEVLVSKIITVGNRKPREEKDLYRLKLDHGRWVISGVEPQGL